MKPKRKKKSAKGLSDSKLVEKYEKGKKDMKKVLKPAFKK